MYDSDKEPNFDDGTDQPGEGDDGENPSSGEERPGEGDGEVKPGDPAQPAITDAILVQPSIVFPTKIHCYVKYLYPSAYPSPEIYLSAGVCYSTSPHPTIFDETTSIQTVKPTGNYLHSLYNLKPNTIYYLRPYRQVDGTFRYGQETSIRTVGLGRNDWLMLKLTKGSGNNMTGEYRINEDHSYKIGLHTWGITATFLVKEAGYRRKGDGGYVFHTWPIEWERTRYFYLSASDLDSGIEYRSEDLYNQ